MAAQDTQPKFIREGGVWSGICLDLARAIEYIDPGIRFKPLTAFFPLSHIEAQLESGDLDVACALARTAKRADHLDVIDIPLYHTFGRLAVRADDPVDVRSFNDLRALGERAIVLAAQGTIQSDLLLAHGLRVDATASRTASNLRKLVEGRGRFLFHNDFALRSMIVRERLEGRVRILPALFDLPGVDSGRYFMISRKAPPELRWRLQVALSTLDKSGELARVFESYRPR